MARLSLYLQGCVHAHAHRAGRGRERGRRNDANSYPDGVTRTKLEPRLLAEGQGPQTISCDILVRRSPEGGKVADGAAGLLLQLEVVARLREDL
jgi:hypothetical protein